MSKRELIKQYSNYAIIALVSLVAMVVIPMLGSDIGLGLNFPDTPAGWVVWGITKACVATVNMLLFHCFTMQGKVNSIKDPHYIEACKILMQYKDKDAEKPVSPRVWLAKQYGFKGTTVFVTSALSAIGLTQAILTFNIVQMITYAITVLMGLVAGVLQMNKAEVYWTDTFYKYALMVKEKQVKENIKQKVEFKKNIEEVIL